MTALRGGFTTGTCAAAAAKAAAMLLAGFPVGDAVDVGLPDGTRELLPLLYARRTAEGADAATRKDAGDDPDVTHGATVVARVAFGAHKGTRFEAGEGVGTVTRPGLALAPGEPAINPGPRAQIAAAVSEGLGGGFAGVTVTVSIPGGEAMAGKTFNPRLGITGGLSILGTSGRVRPYSCSACFESLRCAISVAVASGATDLVLVPGHMGARAALRHFAVPAHHVVELGNDWGRGLDLLRSAPVQRLRIVGHPGKLAKLTAGHWDTHSSRSASAAPLVHAMAERALGHPLPAAQTVEEVFMGLSLEDRRMVGDALASRVGAAVRERLGPGIEASVALINLAGDLVGTEGALAPRRAGVT